MKPYTLISVAASPDEDAQHDDAECEEGEDFTNVHLTCLCSFGAAAGGEPSVMRSPRVWADQHVLSGVEIILQAGETPAVPGASIIRHRASWRPALAVTSVEQDLDSLHVLELVHQGTPQLPLFPGDDDQTQHSLMGGHSVLHADSLQHSGLRGVTRPNGPGVMVTALVRGLR